jgi:integrase
MPYVSSARIPSYRRHRPTGQAVVTVDGKDLYLGLWGTATSKSEYDRLIGEWIANGRRLKNEVKISVNELIAAYIEFALGYYRKHGRPTGTLAGIRIALGFLRGSYGHTLVSEFGPLALIALRERMIQTGQSRSYVNGNIDRIRRCFKWGVSQELVPVNVYQALLSVSGLRKGRSKARETEPIGPVSDETLNATIAKLSPIVADMIRFQRLTGCRPDEVCSLRPCDIERSTDVWLYRPHRHKTEHHDRERIVCIGPKAQSVLLPYLLRDATSPCFSPAESEKTRMQRMRANRKTRVPAPQPVA